MTVMMRCQIRGCDVEVDALSRDEAVCPDCEHKAAQVARRALERLAPVMRELSENAATLNKVLPPQATNDNARPW